MDNASLNKNSMFSNDDDDVGDDVNTIISSLNVHWAIMHKSDVTCTYINTCNVYNSEN